MSNDATLLLPPPPGPCLVGYSGGCDSTVLLHLLAGENRARAAGLRAIHVHHGLHADADAWALHCEATCAALGVPLTVVRVAVDRRSELGPEGAARAARLAAFEAALAPGETLVLAHHRDDQAETVLLRLLRAAGSDGLAGMRSWRAFGPGGLWRPLLGQPRQALRRYAQVHALRWIDDPSNDDPGPDRNFLRLNVMPLLATRWPHAADALARSAGHMAEDAVLLAAEANARLAQVRGVDAQVLSLPALLAQPSAWRPRLLRRWLADLDLPPLPAHAHAVIEQQLLVGRADAQATFRWAGATLQRWRDQLHADRERTGLPADWECAWDGRAPVRLPTGAVLDWVGTPLPTPLPWRLRARRGGERIRLPGRTIHHSLKHVLPALGVPPWERQRLPLLVSPEDEVMAAGDAVASAEFDTWCRAHDGRLRLSPLPRN